jgi:hypothetical protein
MADENIVRSYRSIGPARRPSEPMPQRDVGTRDIGTRDIGTRDETPRSDPLAELARLIGQDDPFADMAPAGARGRTPASAPQPRPDAAPASDWRATAAALAREAMRSPPVADPPFEEADPQVDRINSAIAAIDSYRGGPDARYAEPEHHAEFAEHDADSHYQEEPYREEPYFGASDESQHPEEAASAQPEGHEEPNYFFDGEAPPADQRFYDDPPRTARGNGLVTAAVLVGCALLGTAGAYGYRSYYSGARTTDAPIISADPTPSKMVPATASLDPGKPVQERIGDKAPDERVVTHQEEPVTLGTANPNPAPRVVLPAPFAPTPNARPPAPPTSTSATAPTSSSPAPANGGEPKKVRTVTIRPDGSDTGTRPLNSATPPGQATLPAPPAPARATPPAKPARSNGGPLSLEPGAQPGESAPPAPAPAAPRLASVPAGGGGFFVQLSSQTSEAEAKASFRSLKAKYPNELGDREVSVRSADLGAKGIRYRALVGPVGSSGEATQFCGRLKSAGGDCITQKY